MATSKVTEKEKESLRWDDIEILLECIKEFKSEKEYEGIDWESVKDKYDNIRQRFIKNRNSDLTDNEKYTREKITTKIKATRQNYRKAIDSGRKSGGGRVVATFYDLCPSIRTQGRRHFRNFSTMRWYGLL